MYNKLNLKAIASILLCTVIIFGIVMLLGRILIPFIIALIIAYILNPLVEIIDRRLKIRRSIISFIIAAIMFLLLLSIPIFILPQLITQFTSLIDNIPQLVAVINSKILLQLNIRYGTNLVLDLDNVKTILLDNADMFTSLAKNSLLILETIVYIILIPFVLFYAINDWQKFISFFNSLIPRIYLKSVHKILHDIDLMLSSYLRGQISVMLIMSSYYAVSLHLIDLSLGAVIGIITGFLVFIPYLGILTGFVIALSIAVANSYSSHQIIIIGIVYIIGHILEGGLVTPFLVGSRIGLNPILLILALMICGTLFGFVGVLLALPLTTITVVLLKHAKAYYTQSKYYNELT